MIVDDKPSVIINNFVETVINDRNLDAIPYFMNLDFRLCYGTLESEPVLRGLDRTHDFFLQLFSAFPDWRCTVLFQAPGLDYHWVIWQADGTQEGAFGRFPPTHRRMTYGGAMGLTFVKSQILQALKPGRGLPGESGILPEP